MTNRDLTPWSGSGGLAAFDPRDPFTSFRRQVDRLFDDFLRPGEERSFLASGRWPSLDVRETGQSYVVTAELAGLDPKDVELNLRDNVLTISGEKRQEQNEEDGGRRYTERTFGRFERSIPLEAEVEADKVEADFRNGVLTVTLPKNPQARGAGRRIEIKGADDAGQGKATT